MSRKELNAAIDKEAKRVLRAWLEAAEAHGTIYYSVTHVARSGMSRRIVLSTIRISEKTGKPYLDRLWPHLECESGDFGDYNAAVDRVAKDWGFSFKHRAFIATGSGKDMVFATVYYLAQVSGLDKPLEYTNRVRRDSF